MRKKKKKQLKDFLVEVRARADEGYSTRQLMSSLIPDIGTELKVAASEVTAALPKMRKREAFRGQPRAKKVNISNYNFYYNFIFYFFIASASDRTSIS